MKIRKKRGIFALIVVMILFLATAIFILSNNNKSAYAANDVTYFITVEGDGIVTGSIKNIEVSSFTEDGGSGTMQSAEREEVIFSAEKYYQFSATVEWSAGNVRVNGVPQMPGVCDIDKNIDLRIQTLGLAASEITITFKLEKIEYRISSAAKYIENYVLSDDNTIADGTVIKLSNDDIDDVTTVKLDDIIDISISNEGSNRRFYDYALWNIKGFYDYQHLQKSGKLIINSNFLKNFLLATDEIIVVGAFIRTYSVKISDYIDAKPEENFIEIAISNEFTGYSEELKNKNDIVAYFGAGPVNLDEGTYIKVTRKDIPYFNFDIFSVKEGEALPVGIKDAEYVISYLKYDYEITTLFNKKEYSVSVDCQDNFGRLIELANLNNGLTIGGLNENGKFSIDDIITVELSNGLLSGLREWGYYDNYFTLKEGALPNFINIVDTAKISGMEIIYTESIVKITINAAFLEKYLNRNAESIRIIANFSIKYKFSITLNDETGLGNFYTVSIDGGAADKNEGNYTSVNPLNYGTVITIVLNPSIYASYNCSAYEIEKKGNNTIEIELNYSDRHITITFMLKNFNIEDKTEKFDGYSISANTADGTLKNLSIGNVITINAGVSNNSEIKEWFLNGSNKKLNVLNAEELSLYNAKYTKGSLSIVVNEKWLEDFGYEITNEVKTGMKTSLLMLIIIPSCVVPILIAVLILVLVLNARRKKFIKAELLDEKQTAYTYNAGSMISDLRDDKYNKLTEEEIKAEIKRRKHK